MIRIVILCCVALAGALPLRPASAEVGREQAVRSIEESFAVKVLKVREGELDGRPVWLVTVMNPGGDNNDAWQVNTLAVDRESGDLVPAFRHRSSGYTVPGSTLDHRTTKDVIRPDASRSRTWR